MKKRGIVVPLVLLGIILVLIITIKTGYLVNLKLFRYQGIAMRYLSLLSDGLVLSETREQDYDGTPYIQFFFEADEKADVYQMEGLLYKAWGVMKKHMRENDDLLLKNIDIVVFSYTYKFGVGIRNFDLNGNNRRNKWMLYNAKFESWERIKKYTDLEGLVGCDITSEDNIASYADLFDDLKYIYVCLGRDEAERSENEERIKEVFPNADVDFSKYQRINTVYTIGKR